MARIDVQTAIPRPLGSAQIRLDRPLPAGCILRRISLRIKFHPVGTAGGGTLGHGRIRVNENRRSDAGVLEFAANVRQEVLVFQCVPARIRGYRIFGVRHQRHLRRPHLLYQVNEFRYRISFNVEFDIDERLDLPYVTISYMSFIRSRMDGNSFCSESFAVASRFFHVRQISAPGIAERRDFVDIYT